MDLSRLARLAEPLRQSIFAMIEPLQTVRRRDAPPDRLRVAVLMALPQDIAVLSPLLEALLHADDLDHHLWLDPHLAATRHQTVTRWRAAGHPIIILPRRRVLLGLYDVAARIDLLISAAESDEGAHRLGHALARLARRGGAASLTLQHGLDNVGLTYVPPGRRAARFASDTVAIWGEVEALAASVPEETRLKCVSIGRLESQPPIWRTEESETNATGPKIVTVFENLHWERYSSSYRSNFWSDLQATTQMQPGLRIRLRPHPAAPYQQQPEREFLVSNGLVELVPDDATVIDVAADSFACITTPSTVAVDMAQLGLPIAVVAYDLDLPTYEPLPLLRSIADWNSFLSAAVQRRAGLRRRAKHFARRNVVPGPSIERLMALIRARMAAAQPPAADIRSRRRSTSGE